LGRPHEKKQSPPIGMSIFLDILTSSTSASENL